MTGPSRYGWDSRLADAFAPHAAAGLVPGRVLRVFGTFCDVATTAGPVRADTTALRAHDPMDWVTAGDWAALDPSADPPLLRALLPRRTTMVRNTSSKRSEGQVLAANADRVLIALSAAGDTDLGRAERFLALAWESGADPLIALTKSDLVGEPALGDLVADTAAAAPGVPVLAVSAATGTGMEELAVLLTGGTTVLIGQSGAGKSTLTNALTGRADQTVNAVRDADGKGRHTTTTRDLLPLPGGGCLIDTPGVRGVGMYDSGQGVEQVFTEITALAAGCRFHDCGHTAEPGCAVLAAVDDGSLPPRRLESYRKLLRENTWIASRTDARLRAEQRREWKLRAAEGRTRSRAKRGDAGR